MVFVTIDGNIGVGKSTFIDILQREYPNVYDIQDNKTNTDEPFLFLTNLLIDKYNQYNQAAMYTNICIENSIYSVIHCLAPTYLKMKYITTNEFDTLNQLYTILTNECL